jgi:hypothetical protein
MSSMRNQKLVCAQVMTTATGLSYTAQNAFQIADAGEP